MLIYRAERNTFLKHFAITVQNTKNRSIRKAFQYKSTIKPVIICVLNSEKRLNIPFEVHHSKVQSVHRAVFPLNKTTICTRSTISSPLILRFPGLKLSSIPWQFFFRFTVSKICVFLPKKRNWRLEYSSFKCAESFLPLKFHTLNEDKIFFSRPP